MKLVIQTQYRENYAAHNEDYVHGVDSPYWKFKGGSTYVVANIQSSALYTDSVSAQAMYEIVDEIKASICSADEYSEEYILDWEIANDNAVVCEEWESPIQLFFTDGIWSAMKVDNNRGDMGYRRQEILEVTETWNYESKGERSNYKAEYLMEDGSRLPYSELNEWFKRLEVA